MDDITRAEDELLVIGYLRALKMAKRLKRILQDELGQNDVRLHMCQKAVAVGLGCGHQHDMTLAAYPLAWNGDAAIDLLIDDGFVADDGVAVEAIDRLEDRVHFVPRSQWHGRGHATVH